MIPHRQIKTVSSDTLSQMMGSHPPRKNPPRHIIPENVDKVIFRTCH
jgi:hypothetical protein